MPENRINTYRCDTCGETIVTIDRVGGVTPAFLLCKATGGCSGTMHSGWYNCDQRLKPKWEWYRPASLKGMDEWTRDHVERGGLILQRIPPNDEGIEDPNLRDVVTYLHSREFVSTVMLQRMFKFTYMKAAQYLDELVRRRMIEEKKDKLGQHKVLINEAQPVAIQESDE